jgi:hypothetical protein
MPWAIQRPEAGSTHPLSYHSLLLLSLHLRGHTRHIFPLCFLFPIPHTHPASTQYAVESQETDAVVNFVSDMPLSMTPAY